MGKNGLRLMINIGRKRDALTGVERVHAALQRGEQRCSSDDSGGGELQAQRQPLRSRSGAGALPPLHLLLAVLRPARACAHRADRSQTWRTGNTTSDCTLSPLYRSYFKGTSANIKLQAYSVTCC
jgi:hypothetical protein